MRSTSWMGSMVSPQGSSRSRPHRFSSTPTISRPGNRPSPRTPLLSSPSSSSGVTLGFLRYNFFPAKIFMGDSGSMLLGLVLGAATVSGVGTRGDPQRSQLGGVPGVLPSSHSPCWSSRSRSSTRCWRHSPGAQTRSLFHADKEHLHHRLMDLGHGHRQAVIVMYIWSALAAGAGLAFSFSIAPR